MKVVLDRSQVVQWPYVSPKDFILHRLGQEAFSKSPSHMSEGRNHSASVRSFNLSVKNDMHWWVHCSNLASFGISTHSPTNPVASKTVMVCMGEAEHTQKFPMSMTLTKVCGWWCHQPSACEVSGVGKTKYATFGSTDGREGWKIGPGPQLIMSSLEDIPRLLNRG